MGHQPQHQLQVLRYSKKPTKRAVILLHGYGANNEDLFSLAPYLDQQGEFDWFFPNGVVEIPLNWWMTGRAWFPIDIEAMQRAQATGTWRDLANSVPEQMEQSLSIVEDWIKNDLKSYDELILGGFSQGAMMASHLFSRHPLNITKLVFLSGALINQSSLDKNLATIAKSNVRIFQSHGAQDPVLAIHQGEELRDQFLKHQFQIDFHSFPGGHEIPEKILNQLRQFIFS